MLSLNPSDDVLRNLIDASRVAVAGQLFGGWTAAEAMQADPRFYAALLMNPATIQRPPADPAQVARPVLMMRGELDARVPFAANEDFFARMLSTSNRWLLIVPNAGHEFAGSHDSKRLRLLLSRPGRADPTGSWVDCAATRRWRTESICAASRHAS